MSDYISTKDKNFNAKQELENLLKFSKNKGNDTYLGAQQVSGSLTPKMIIEYKKKFVVNRVDERNGRAYEFDTRTQKEYKNDGYLGDLHPVLEYHYEVNNIPKPGSGSNINLNDIKYLEARINYERALSYKDQGDIKNRGLRVKTYNDKVNSDKKNNRFLEDGVTTVYEASYAGKLNALETAMTNAYENSSYWTKDLSVNDTIIQNKVKTETKENEEKSKVVPVVRDDRYMKMIKVQSQLDQTINKNPLKDKLKISNPKDVQTYDLRNLLQIEQ